MKKVPFDTAALQEWFQCHKRALPWREEPSPYRVWISEIMLQQTQASVVEEYFQRWMLRFPNVQLLAQASLEEVLKMWEGLGYYSRARHIHAAAQWFVQRHGGEIPGKRAELEKIKGFGPYTVGALLSFAFHERAAAVDANVARVLARYFCIEEPISTSSARKKIWDLAEAILPDSAPWTVVEGLIELGAVVCTQCPKCMLCPLRKGCRALRESKHTHLPYKAKPRPTTLLKRQVAVIYWQDHILLKKGASRRVMADLYEFPYLEGIEEDLHSFLTHTFSLQLQFEKTLQPQNHSFTRYRAQLFPSVWRAREKKDVENHIWISWKERMTLPFSAGHRRILNTLESIKDAHFTH